MPDSWEFACHHATGEYLTVLTDDSYLLRDAISLAMQCVEAFNTPLVTWKLCTYFSSKWYERTRRNVLYIPKCSQEPRFVSSDSTLRALFSLKPSLSAPKFLNSLCHRSLAEKIIAAQGRLFLPPCPDYSFSVAALSLIDRYVYLDRPLFIDGKFPESIGAAQRFTAGRAAADFLTEFQNRSSFEKLWQPNLPTVAVAIAQTLENTKRHYHRTSHMRISQEAVIRDSVKDLLVHKSNGTRNEAAWDVLQEYLRDQPGSLQRAVSIAKIRTIGLLWLRRIRQMGGWNYLERLRGNVVLAGANAGFSDLAECGRCAEALLCGARERGTRIF
jgi:hypothetical protein